MKPTVLLRLTVLLPIYASSQTADKYAPLPDQIVKAKTVFLIRVEFHPQS
jgi:hypothetical protein